MTTARRQAMTMLESLGTSADHLPEAAQKAAHAKLVKDLNRVIDVIDKHLREAVRDRPPRRKATPRTSAPHSP